MSLVTLEVDIDDGRVTPKEPDLLPKHGKGLLTLVSSESDREGSGEPRRVVLPLIPATGHTLNPTRDELDASLWD